MLVQNLPETEHIVASANPDVIKSGLLQILGEYPGSQFGYITPIKGAPRSGWIVSEFPISLMSSRLPSPISCVEIAHIFETLKIEAIYEGKASIIASEVRGLQVAKLKQRVVSNTVAVVWAMWVPQPSEDTSPK